MREVFAVWRDGTSMDSARLAADGVGPQRNQAHAPFVVPWTVRVKAQRLIDPGGQRLERYSAPEEIHPCRRALRLTCRRPDGQGLACALNVASAATPPVRLLETHVQDRCRDFAM